MPYYDVVMINGRTQLREVTEQEFYSLMLSPADGVYDEAFDKRHRENQARVRERYARLPNRGLGMSEKEIREFFGTGEK